MCDIVVLYLLKRRQYYKDCKYQSVVPTTTEQEGYEVQQIFPPVMKSIVVSFLSSSNVNIILTTVCLYYSKYVYQEYIPYLYQIETLILLPHDVKLLLAY